MSEGRPMRAAGAVPWTREEIDAWVRGEGAIRPLITTQGRAREVTLLVRRTVVRLCPEVPDYDALCARLGRSGHFNAHLNERAGWTDDEAIAHVENAVAALWQQSLSAPVEGDATEEADGN